MRLWTLTVQRVGIPFPFYCEVFCYRFTECRYFFTTEALSAQHCTEISLRASQSLLLKSVGVKFFHRRAAENAKFSQRDVTIQAFLSADNYYPVLNLKMMHARGAKL